MNEIKLYPNQIKAKEAIANSDKGIICMPTATGKTFSQADAIADDINKSMENLKSRPFFLLFLLSVIIVSLFVLKNGSKISILFPVLAMVILWIIPGLGLLGRIICTIIYFSILSLIIIKSDDIHKFNDHAKFLLMI